MNFEIHGPFDIQRNGNLIDKSPQAKKIFWASVEEAEPGLPNAVGCYVFCVGKKPWYVGLAEKQNFASECFQPHKLNAFNYALDKIQGKPTLLLISMLTPVGRFAKPRANGHKAIKFLEDILIGMAITRNSDLENIRGTKFLKEMIVPGLLNTPQGKAKKSSVQFLKSVLGV